MDSPAMGYERGPLAVTHNALLTQAFQGWFGAVGDHWMCCLCLQVVLIDPPGSSLFNKVKRGVLYTRHEAEGKRLKNPFDTITEGIGINRITANFSKAKV